MIYDNSYISDDELYHHGVKGMHWGVRRYQDKNGRRIGTKSKISEPEKFGDYGLKLKNKPSTQEEDVKNTNPHFSYGLFNKKYQCNCANCSMAYEMRRRGYDVEASGNKDCMYVGSITKFFNGMTKDSIAHLDLDDSINNEKPSVEKGEKVKKAYEKAICDNFPKNSRGMTNVTFYWGAHFFNWERDASGKVSFYDAQNPKSNLDTTFINFLKVDNINPISMIRLDNLEANENITTVINNAGEKKTMTYDSSGNDLDKMHPNDIERYL